MPAPSLVKGRDGEGLGGVVRLNHHAKVTGGVLAEECGKVLSDFFAMRRAQQRNAAAAAPAPSHLTRLPSPPDGGYPEGSSK